MRLKKTSLAIIIALIISLLVPWQVAAVPAVSADNIDSAYLQEVKNFIKDRYYFEVNESQIQDGAMKGMFESLDDYSEFYTREEAESFLEAVDGNYEGVGIALAKADDYVIITRVFPSSPAENAGLLSGDKIVTVEQKDVRGISVDEISTLIRGPRGSVVRLGILRNNQLMEFSVKREGIKLNPVNYEIREGIGYVSIESFNSNTHEYLLAALKALDNEKISKIVLDLRDNTGGEVTQSVAVARQFVPAGVITTLKFKAGDIKDKTYTSSLAQTKYKLVVLVNGMTASASEIVSGAIQDSGAGILIGTKTYGKGRVQAVVPLLTPEAFKKYSRQYGDFSIDSNELVIRHGIQPADHEIMGWAKITTGIYLTPSGKCIDGTGLTPDIMVADSTPLNGFEIKNLVKLSKSSKPFLNSTDIDVYNAEKILAACDYAVGKPDLILDQQTFAAIKQFQLDRGLYPCGILDYSTQDALNGKRQELIMNFDQQYARATAYLNKN